MHAIVFGQHGAPPSTTDRGVPDPGAEERWVSPDGMKQMS